MESSTRSRNPLGRRSIVARIAAVLALAASILALYLVYKGFTDEEKSGEPVSAKQGRSEQPHKKGKKSKAPTYTVIQNDTLSGIAQKTGVSVSKLTRLNPGFDAETLQAGQVLKLRP